MRRWRRWQDTQRCGQGVQDCGAASLALSVASVLILLILTIVVRAAVIVVVAIAAVPRAAQRRRWRQLAAGGH